MKSTETQSPYPKRIQDCMSSAAECLAIIADDAANSGDDAISLNARTLAGILRGMAEIDYTIDTSDPAGMDTRTSGELLDSLSLQAQKTIRRTEELRGAAMSVRVMLIFPHTDTDDVMGTLTTDHAASADGIPVADDDHQVYGPVEVELVLLEAAESQSEIAIIEAAVRAGFRVEKPHADESRVL